MTEESSLLLTDHLRDLPQKVRLVEVGPRDGLQNEANLIGLDIKKQLIEALADTGLTTIEAGSFVNPKWVPQMAGSDELFRQLAPLNQKITLTALTPNIKGFERAVASGVREVAVFAAASEGFSQKNINCSIAESLQRFEPVVEAATAKNIPVRGYISCVLGCPYDGDVAPDEVHAVASALLAMGCYEVSLGDTIGVGTPGKLSKLLHKLYSSIPNHQLALHLHDTYGQALANIFLGLQMGISVYDTSVAGLGGCPYAKGATGNVATEDVVYLLEGLGIEHGVDLQKLVKTGQWISEKIGRANNSRAGAALAAKEKP